MSNTMDIMDMNQIATVLSELVQDYNELARCWYDVFHDPTAKDITLKLLDIDGNLRTYTIPNRAKDRNFILNGVEDPEGNVHASTGSIYQNTNTGTLFIKTRTEGGKEVCPYHWKEIKPVDNFILSGSTDPHDIYPSENFPYGMIYTNTTVGSVFSNTPDGWKTVGASGFAEEAWCRREFENIKKNINETVVHLKGKEYIEGEKIFENNTTFKKIATFEKVIMGTSYRALSADIAEYYEADAEYKPGTLVQFGGEKEITVAKDMVNAVVSTDPAYVLNAEKNMEYPALLALSGRVPVRVKGKVEKFDLIKMSDEEGVAIVDNSCYNPIGRALETNLEEGEKLVECVVKLNL